MKSLNVLFVLAVALLCVSEVSCGKHKKSKEKKSSGVSSANTGNSATPASSTAANQPQPSYFNLSDMSTTALNTAYTAATTLAQGASNCLTYARKLAQSTFNQKPKKKKSKKHNSSSSDSDTSSSSDSSDSSEGPRRRKKSLKPALATLIRAPAGRSQLSAASSSANKKQTKPSAAVDSKQETSSGSWSIWTILMVVTGVIVILGFGAMVYIRSTKKVFYSDL